MFNKILVVCLGNICRSPMAEALFKQRVQEKNLPIAIHSAGIEAMVDWPADPLVQEILWEQGLDCRAHRARQLTEPLLLASDLVLVMEHYQKKTIEYKTPNACGRIRLLGEWTGCEIPDPYQQSKAAFEETYRLIEQGVDAWITKAMELT